MAKVCIFACLARFALPTHAWPQLSLSRLCLFLLRPPAPSHAFPHTFPPAVPQDHGRIRRRRGGLFTKRCVKFSSPSRTSFLSSPTFRAFAHTADMHHAYGCACARARLHRGISVSVHFCVDGLFEGRDACDTRLDTLHGGIFASVHSCVAG